MQCRAAEQIGPLAPGLGGPLEQRTIADGSVTRRQRQAGTACPRQAGTACPTRRQGQAGKVGAPAGSTPATEPGHVSRKLLQFILTFLNFLQ